MEQSQVVGGTQALRARAAASEGEMARHEAGIEQLVWVIRIVAFLLAAAAAAALLVIARADSAWQFIAYPLLAGVPVLYSMIAARWLRLMHVTVLQRHQAQLLIRNAELQEMASKDELTQLYNRRHFYELLQTELDRARSSRGPLALMVLDVDGLKGINDEHGHQVGDAVIANLGKVIARHTRNTDVAARLGGDEFGVIMPDTDKRGAFGVAQRLWTDLERTPMFEENGHSIIVSVSIGVSGFPWGGEDVDEMMHWADADMYANKASRRLAPAAADAPAATGPRSDDLGVGF